MRLMKATPLTCSEGLKNYCLTTATSLFIPCLTYLCLCLPPSVYTVPDGVSLLTCMYLFKPHIHLIIVRSGVQVSPSLPKKQRDRRKKEAQPESLGCALFVCVCRMCAALFFRLVVSPCLCRVVSKKHGVKFAR